MLFNGIHEDAVDIGVCHIAVNLYGQLMKGIGILWCQDFLCFLFPVDQFRNGKRFFRCILRRIAHAVNFEACISILKAHNITDIVLPFHAKLIFRMIVQTEVIGSKDDTRFSLPAFHPKFTLDRKDTAVFRAYRRMRCADPLSSLPCCIQRIHKACLEGTFCFCFSAVVIPHLCFYLIFGTGLQCFSFITNPC